MDSTAILAVHEATRSLLDALEPLDVVEAVSQLVRDLGGDIVPARAASEQALPFDLSFGLAEPVLPTAPPASVARLHLETLLPTFLEDARRSVMELRGKSLLQTEATRDHLTGLLNRRTLDRRISQLLAGDSLAILDLDYFKALNDSEGHAAGDAVLAAFGQVVRSHVRGGDIAGRYGGEEFVVAVSAAGPKTLEARLVDIRRSWESLRPFPVSFSAGVSPVETTGTVALGAADRALYRAKDLGRNRIETAAEQR